MNKKFVQDAQTNLNVNWDR